MIRCGLAAGAVVSVDITPRAAVPVERLALGKPPQAVPALFALLFSLCPKAHALAAATGLERALGIVPAPDLMRVRELQATAERLRELGLNLLLPADEPISPWPSRLIASCRRLIVALGGDAALWPAAAFEPDIASVRTALSDLRELAETVLGDFARMSEPDLAAVRHWSGRGDCVAAVWLKRTSHPDWLEFGRCAVAGLPPWSDATAESALAPGMRRVDPTRPEWEGQPRETGCLIRQAADPLVREALTAHGNGLFTRTLARIVELKSLLHDLATAAERLAPVEAVPPPRRQGGCGVAQVEAARGRLMHRVEVADGRVCDYRILAPTEWNFHPRGLVYRALQGASVGDADAARGRIEAFLHSVDPCVDHRLILDAAG